MTTTESNTNDGSTARASKKRKVDMTSDKKSPEIRLREIEHYVRSKEYLSSVQKDERRGVRKTASNFAYEGK